MAYEPMILPYMEHKPTYALMDTLSITTFPPTAMPSTMATSLLKSNKSFHLLDMANKNSSLDITENDFRLFVEYMQLYKTTHECADYCKGDFYQMLRAYNGIHGYVALMVSIIQLICLS